VHNVLTPIGRILAPSVRTDCYWSRPRRAHCCHSPQPVAAWRGR